MNNFEFSYDFYIPGASTGASRGASTGGLRLCFLLDAAPTSRGQNYAAPAATYPFFY